MIIKRISNKQLSGIIILLIVLSLMVFYISQTDNPKPKTSEISKLITATKADNNESLSKEIFVINNVIEPIVIISSIKGSDADGGINIDEYGMVIVDHDLKRLFDYFFTTTGELSLVEIKDQLKLFAQMQLDASQLEQLMNIFDQYSKYLSSYESFTQSLPSDLSQIQRLALISDFRIETLGSKMALSFFDEEESYIQFVLSNKQSQNGEWTDQQQNWLVSENNATAYLDTIDENKYFNGSETLTETEINDYRTEQYGQQAAQRLALLDIQREQWQQTVSDYNQQRQLIVDKQSDLNLVQLHGQYSEQDSRRLKGLWRMSQ